MAFEEWEGITTVTLGKKGEKQFQVLMTVELCVVPLPLIRKTNEQQKKEKEGFKSLSSQFEARQSGVPW